MNPIEIEILGTGCKKCQQLEVNAKVALVNLNLTALSLPEMVILKKVLRPQLLAIFIGLMTIDIISIGYIFNALLT